MVGMSPFFDVYSNRERQCVCVCLFGTHRDSSESRCCAFGCQAKLAWRSALMVGMSPFFDVYSNRERQCVCACVCLARTEIHPRVDVVHSDARPSWRGAAP